MVDVTAIAGTVSALKGAMDITKAMIGLRDGQAMQTKIIELNHAILEAQRSAFAANDERSTLIDRIRALEKEVAGLKAWNTEKERYQLQEMGCGAFAYVLKAEASGGQPLHALCQTCYERGVKSLLQSNGAARWDEHFWACPVCKAQVRARSNSLKPAEEA